jgi:iron complex transport system ATP-binding protein
VGLTLEVREAVCGYGKRIVAKNISFTAGSGEVISILGANGVGKTTLFKTVLGHLALLGGRILLRGGDISVLSRRERARLIGYVPQSHTPPFPYKAMDVVIMGRTAHISLFSAPSASDREIAEAALETVGASHLADRVYTEISGGERQLVLIARALAQQPEILIMDEPTANLDFGNQVKMMMLINGLAESGLTVIMTTHIPDHVFMCSSKVALIKNEDEFLTGSAGQIITRDALREIYGIEVSVETVSVEGRDATVCVPILYTRD